MRKCSGKVIRRYELVSAIMLGEHNHPLGRPPKRKISLHPEDYPIGGFTYVCKIIQDENIVIKLANHEGILEMIDLVLLE